MIIKEGQLLGVFVLKPEMYSDPRGYFIETYRESVINDRIASIRFIQENESLSNKNVLRGLHFQEAPHEQSKLVRVVRGKIQDVVVDIRPDSATFGRYMSIVLSGENKKQLFIPKGFAHGFVALEDNTVVVYKVDAYYAPGYERCIRWNDRDLNITWQTEGTPVVSEKDNHGETFKNIRSKLKEEAV